MDRVCSSRCGILVNRVHTTFMDCCPSDIVYVFYTSNLSLISKLSAGADVCQSQVTSELSGGMCNTPFGCACLESLEVWLSGGGVVLAVWSNSLDGTS